MFKFSKSFKDETDEQLMALVAGGNQQAFNILYNRYNNRLLYYFYRMLGNSNEKAQDFLQELFVKVIDKAETFDTSRKFSTWLFSIAHNLCKNEYRRMEVRNETGIELAAELMYEGQEDFFPAESIDVDVFVKDLFIELDSFDEIHKSVFLLHYREGFSVKDIAQVQSISEGTVKSRLFYTRKRLAERLEKYQQVIK